MNEPIPAFLSRDHDGEAGTPGMKDAPMAADGARLAVEVLGHVHSAPDAGEDMVKLVRSFDMEKTALVPAGMRITGNISTEGDLGLVVFGVVDGDITTESGVYVMGSGTVNGHIKSTGEVIVAGHVRADGEAAVHTTGPFSLAAGGEVHGDVEYKSLRIHEGGVIRGRLMPVGYHE